MSVKGSGQVLFLAILRYRSYGQCMAHPGYSCSKRSSRSIAFLRLRFAALRTGAPFKTYKTITNRRDNFHVSRILGQLVYAKKRGRESMCVAGRAEVDSPLRRGGHEADNIQFEGIVRMT